MSDGSPILGPKFARPNQGQPRLSSPMENSDGSGGMMPGIVVLPWRLVKPSDTRSVVANTGLGTSVTIELPVDTSFQQIS